MTPIGATSSLAAFVFAAQALQFPIPGGASGHLLGGTLIASLVGTRPAVVAMAAVFTVQALFFHDGGMTTLGANICNGALVPIAFTAIALRFTVRASRRAAAIAAGVAAFAGVVAGAAACSAEVALSGTSPFIPFLSAMVASHLWIGLGEAIITGHLVYLLLPAVARGSRPETGAPSQAPGRRPWRRILSVAAMILILTIAAEFLSSRSPDGLESAARRLGLAPAASIEPVAEAPWRSVSLTALGAAAVAWMMLPFLGRARASREP